MRETRERRRYRRAAIQGLVCYPVVIRDGRRRVVDVRIRIEGWVKMITRRCVLNESPLTFDDDHRACRAHPMTLTAVSR